MLLIIRMYIEALLTRNPMVYEQHFEGKSTQLVLSAYYTLKLTTCMLCLSPEEVGRAS